MCAGDKIRDGREGPRERREEVIEKWNIKRRYERRY